MKFKIIIIVIFLFLNAIIGIHNFDINAENLKYEMSSISNTLSKNRPGEKTFNWGDIEVISEPNYNQNININDSRDPQIAVENDNIYIVWKDKTDYNGAGGDADIFYRHFNGNQWSEIQVISEPVIGQNINIGDSFEPRIVVRDGTIYITWHDNNNTNNAGTDFDIFYRSNLTGSGWEDIQVISEPVQGQNQNIGGSIVSSIAVDNNRIYISWTDNTSINNAGTDYDIFYRSNLTGIGWEDIQVISEPVFGKNLNNESSSSSAISVENSNIYFAWTDWNNTNGAGTDPDIFYRCNITGNGWEDIQVISEPIFNEDYNTENSWIPKIAVENNEIYIVWWDQNNTNDAGTDYDIFYRCNLTGNNWETIQVISESIPGSNSNTEWSSHVDIAIESGKIYTVWYDFNNINGCGWEGEIFYRSNITGANWEDIYIISEPEIGKNLNTEFSGYPDIVANLGRIYICWLDSNDTYKSGTDEDIFLRSISLTSVLSSSGVVPNSGNTSTEFNFTVAYYHLYNESPMEIGINISGIEYQMIGCNPSDTNYMDGKKYYFKISNLKIGINKYQFYANDGVKKEFTRIFTNLEVYNTPPNITTQNNLKASEDIYYEVNYNYKDIDITNINQNGLWTVSTNASWLEFNQTTTSLYGMPTNDDVGTYWVNISVYDTIDLDYTNFTLTVLNINDAPIIITNDTTIINEDESYEVNYEAIDIDDPLSSLKWSLNSNATWLYFDPLTSILNGTPENADVGTYWVNISVGDNEDLDFSNFTLIVMNVNDPPKIITENNVTAIEDELYYTIYNAYDVDNTQNHLKWQISTNANWLEYNISNLTIYGIPRNENVGEYWVNVSVSDYEYTDSRNFTLTVLNINDPPVITTPDITNATIGELYSVNYEAEDIDPITTIFSWYQQTNASDWLTIDSNTGWLNGIPKEDDYGVFWVNVSVTDNQDGWAFHNFSINILRKFIKENNAPELFNASLLPGKGNTKTVFTFSIHYYDLDGDLPKLIQVVIDDGVYNMKLKAGENASNGIYEHFTLLSKGLHSYYFIASDGLEIANTNNLTTSEIKKEDTKSSEDNLWIWLSGIVIVVIIIFLLMTWIILKKRKEIPTVRAELLYKPPEHIVKLGATPTISESKILPTQPTVAQQLQKPEVKVQPEIALAERKEPTTVPSLTGTPAQPQYQLPQATLSREQRLGLLKERLLRGEVSEGTYKELKAEIEGKPEMGITDEDIKPEPLEQQSESQINTNTQPIHITKEPSIGYSTEAQITQTSRHQENIEDMNNSHKPLIDRSSKSNQTKNQTTQENETHDQ